VIFRYEPDKIAFKGGFSPAHPGFCPARLDFSPFEATFFSAAADF
jgi:hypothetical protein